MNLRYVGLDLSAAGRSARAALIAACTSRAAPLMSRLMSNCSTICVELTLLRDVISSTPAILPRWRSSGVATLDAMISGLAPGIEAFTTMVGMSMLGNGETGNSV